MLGENTVVEGDGGEWLDKKINIKQNRQKPRPTLYKTSTRRPADDGPWAIGGDDTVSSRTGRWGGGEEGETIMKKNEGLKTVKSVQTLHPSETGYHINHEHHTQIQKHQPDFLGCAKEGT